MLEFIEPIAGFILNELLNKEISGNKLVGGRLNILSERIKKGLSGSG